VPSHEEELKYSPAAFKNITLYEVISAKWLEGATQETITFVDWSPTVAIFGYPGKSDAWTSKIDEKSP